MNMVHRFRFLLLCSTLLAGASFSVSAKGEPRVTVVSKDKAWIENLVLDPDSESLFMSELKFGRVWRVRGDAQSNGTAYTETLWLSGFQTTLGLTRDVSRPGIPYGVGELGGKNVVYRFSSLVPNNMTVLATLPAACLGNGLGVHYVTGKLYTACEGNFEPGTGSVYEVDPTTGAVTALTTSMWAADGLWIDQERALLYVGELFSTAVQVWNISGDAASAPVPRGRLAGFKGGFLDDFTLAQQDGAAIVGCDWSGDTIMVFNALPTNGTITPTPLVRAGLEHPTSARWGYALQSPSSPPPSSPPPPPSSSSSSSTDPFPATALFVSEGRARDFLVKTRNDRLLRIDFD